MDFVPQSKPRLWQNLVEITMNTGMRAGEIRQLQWAHVDLKAGVFRLPREITKTKRARVVPITPEVVEAIKSLPRHLHGYVVTCKGRPLTGLSGVKRRGSLWPVPMQG